MIGHDWKFNMGAVQRNSELSANFLRGFAKVYLPFAKSSIVQNQNQSQSQMDASTDLLERVLLRAHLGANMLRQSRGRHFARNT